MSIYKEKQVTAIYLQMCMNVCECVPVCVCVVGRVCVVDPVGDALKWAILIQNFAMSLRDPFLPMLLFKLWENDI